MSKRCFVIMPFSGTSDVHTQDYWTRFFETFIKPEVMALGYQCERSRTVPLNINKSVLAELSTSDLVLAVLTDGNPNVWYELGVRHTLRHGTIMITEEGSVIPFDVREHGVLKYEVKGADGLQFKEDLKGFVEAIERPTGFDNPVRDFLSDQPTKLVSAAFRAEDSPLLFLSALARVKQKLLVVGQNLQGLTRPSMKDSVFDALRRRSIDLELLVCDSSPEYVAEATREFTHNDFVKDLDVALTSFREWQREADSEKTNGTMLGRLEIRLSRRIGNVSATFVDPDLDTGMLELTPVLYESESARRPRFLLTKRDHGEIFALYRSTYDTLFRVRDSRSIRAL